ncbi:SGNH/GDSL hydrolase family protein [Dyadobacter luticola]|uniref:Uncharacterized protein n=1 Tax=Dyadobacter luticola TaxID=1979387 RepID=A0A5R9L5T2_9BACT|nr:SGNH/GDSL hydrolase family protein [Dyadobacter luticola]TLV03923.1 hypothetical protein FEN17_10155 [Dyadobacter luticola]
MSKTQTRLVMAMTGLFLLSVTIYRWQAFTHFIWTILLFKALVPASLLMICYGLGRMLRLPLVVCLALPPLAEAINWQYIRHFIRINQVANVHHIGILERWIDYRDVIQFNRQFSSFNNDLGYTLWPGSIGAHSSLEYHNQYQINSLGVRDDEKSLENPEIIFLGDSFTMGWGIDQDKTFAHLTEKQLGVKALNAGISSYGTFREMLLFKKLQRDSCKLLVIQYCDNDLEENVAHLREANPSQRLTPEKFEKVTIFNRINESYFPMRYTYFFLREKDILKRIFTNPLEVWSDSQAALTSWISGKPLAENKPAEIKSSSKVREHTENFYHVLKKIREIYSGNIVVMHLDGRYTKPELINAFEAQAKQSGDTQLHFLRTADFLTAHDYFPVDGHLNAAGHQKVASKLGQLIREVGGISSHVN